MSTTMNLYNVYSPGSVAHRRVRNNTVIKTAQHCDVMMPY